MDLCGGDLSGLSSRKRAVTGRNEEKEKGGARKGVERPEDAYSG